MFRAFGVVETPDYDQYLEFLESRCFPSSRDKMKLILKDLDLPFYDPMMIIEKTEGRMAEDDFWIRHVFFGDSIMYLPFYTNPEIIFCRSTFWFLNDHQRIIKWQVKIFHYQFHCITAGRETY